MRRIIAIIAATATLIAGVSAVALTAGDQTELAEIRKRAANIVKRTSRLSAEVPSAARDEITAAASTIIQTVDEVTAGGTPSPSPTPVTGLQVAVAGDICGSCSATGNLLDARQRLDLVLTTGDNAYNDGTLAQFTQKYHPHWGPYRGITRPSSGNHDWHTANAQGMRDYFGAKGWATTGPAHYSFAQGGWTFVALDTTKIVQGGQPGFVTSSLSGGSSCEIVYGHHPRYSSGEHGNSTNQDAVFKAAVDGGAELILWGHDHDYERFARLNRSGVADPSGIQAVVVGTGGAGTRAFKAPKATSLVRIVTHGVLFLTLDSGSYSAQFVDTTGTVRDTFSGVCR